jgi:hypothetical protein
MQIDLETYETQRIPSASHFLFSSAGSKRHFISQRWQGREFFCVCCRHIACSRTVERCRRFMEDYEHVRA